MLLSGASGPLDQLIAGVVGDFGLTVFLRVPFSSRYPPHNKGVPYSHLDSPSSAPIVVAPPPSRPRALSRGRGQARSGVWQKRVPATTSEGHACCGRRQGSTCCVKLPDERAGKTRKTFHSCLCLSSWGYWTFAVYL